MVWIEYTGKRCKAKRKPTLFEYIKSFFNCFNIDYQTQCHYDMNHTKFPDYQYHEDMLGNKWK